MFQVEKVPLVDEIDTLIAVILRYETNVFIFQWFLAYMS